MPRSLIEQWFPASAVGAESLRERATFTALPAPFALHVWWARRPLIASRAAITATLLPAWPDEAEAQEHSDLRALRQALEAEFPKGEPEYHAWVVQALGIAGDPVAARAAIAAARQTGTTTQGNAYGYDRAFTVSADQPTIDRLRRLAALRAEVDEPPSVFDPFAGGGSIPFEAVRMSCRSIGIELNPVSVGVLQGTTVLPVRLGQRFTDVLRRWGSVWIARVQGELAPYFPREYADERNAFIWAHTIPCPTTQRPTPLAPNYWLAAGRAETVAVALEPDQETGVLRTRVVSGPNARQFGERATYSRGTASSVWDPTATISGAEIQLAAQNGSLGQVLLAVSSTRQGVRGRQFRAPSAADLAAARAAEDALAERLPSWKVGGQLPDDPVFPGEKTDEPRRMGLTDWSQFFAPRQLLSHMISMEQLQDTLHEARKEVSDEEWRALALYLAFAFDKALNYNSRMSTWHPYRDRVANTFDRHDFAFKWSFAELDGAWSLLPWAVEQVVSTYRQTASLLEPPASLEGREPAIPAEIILGSATDLTLPDRSVDAVVTDPPYYDNVMYAELSDYFYVWLRRILHESWPELTVMASTDKDREAVANPSLFRDVATHSGRRRRVPGSLTADELADRRYEELLTRAFSQVHRVLKDDGVMTVMFTHKRVDAWDKLGAALMEAGFEVSSSWPVHTEAENSLHQAKKNSASSTILLGCRKRLTDEPAYWSDIRRLVEDAAERAAKRFSAEGLKGVDLTLATYGPALSVLSRNWPVYTGNLTADGEREKLRPDAALDLARHRVALLKKRELLGGRDVEFDRATDWWLLAWNDFQAAQFPAGEALKLCIAMDLDLDDVAKQHKLVKAASGDVTLLTPAQRRTAKSLDPDAGTWPTLVDALHALMLTHDEEGLSASRSWLASTGKGDDERFGALVEAAIHAVPRTRDKDGDFTRPESRILESLRATLFDWIETPPEPELGEALTLDFAEG